MKELILEPFQAKGIENISTSLSRNRSIIACSPTGSGKTVLIASIASRFIDKNPSKNVIVFVHRLELLGQVREALWNYHGILSQKIDDKTKYIEPGARVFVAMVETFDNRSDNYSFLSKFHNIGLAMIDECHMSNFKKIMIHFVDGKTLGFTATPVAATKKDPLLNYYHDIVVIATIPELIELNQRNPLRGVVPAREFALGIVDRSRLSVRGEDFNEDVMGAEFGTSRQIQNTINAYIKYGYGKKTICFNVNIEHSLKMHHAFLQAGIPSRHLDGKKSGPYGNTRYREETWKWFKSTPNAVLNNVGIATIGTDVPSIETVIVNRSTKSLTLWKQMIGRGGRPCQFQDGTLKEDFLILDMGDNIEGGKMGRYDELVDWEFMFRNPQEPRPGTAATKRCPECGGINYASVRICTALRWNPVSDETYECGYCFPLKEAIEDTVEREMRQIGEDGIDVKKNIEYFADRKEYFSYFEMFKQIAGLYRKRYNLNYLDAELLSIIFSVSYEKASEWHKIKGKRKYPNFRKSVEDLMVTCLTEVGFDVSTQELEDIRNGNV